jgi:hypothetical protein
MVDFRLRVKLGAALVCVGLGALGCKDEPAADSDAGSGECADGKEGCACYGNGTCNAKLVCLSKFCVDPNADEEEDGNEDEGDQPAGKDGGDVQGDEDGADAPTKDESGARDDASAGDDKDDGDDPPNADESSADESSADESSADEPGAGDDSDEPAGDDPADDPDDVEPSSDDATDDAPSLDASVTSADDTSEPGSDEPSTDDTGEPATDDTVSDDATDEVMTDDTTDPPSPEGNLISNGNFASGVSDWNIEVPSSIATISDGALCLTAEDGYYVYGPVGWPLDPLDAFALQSGRRYRFEFDAWVSDEVGANMEYLNAKVGEAIMPYTSIFSWDPQVSGERGTYAGEFVADADYPQVGIVFSLETAVIEMCFGNVSFVALD